jgi:hypothetical protein
MRQHPPERQNKKPAYFAGLVAFFLFAFGFGVKGVGGVASIRRSTSSMLGGGASCVLGAALCRFGLSVRMQTV